MKNLASKYFVVDIDGCITDGKGREIDLGLLLELKNVIERNQLDFSLCTGRSAPYVEAICQLLNIKSWCVCENGAYIYYPHSDQIEYHPLITQEVLSTIKQLKLELSSEKYKSICKIEAGKEVCLSLNPLNCSVAELHDLVLSLTDGLELYTNHSASAVDITPKGVDKGSALNFIADKKGISLSNIVAIGDSEGDLPFMKISGFKACPLNSSVSVSMVSNYQSTLISTRGVIATLLYLGYK